MPETLLAYIYCDTGGVCGSTHGFDGRIAADPQAQIYLFPEYDPTSGPPRRFLKSTADSLQHVLTSSPPGVPLSLVSTSETSLDTLPALRVVATFTEPNSTTEMTVEVIFGLRIVSRSQTILYSIGLAAPSHRFAKSKPIFDALVRSFKVVPVAP